MKSNVQAGGGGRDWVFRDSAGADISIVVDGSDPAVAAQNPEGYADVFHENIRLQNVAPERGSPRQHRPSEGQHVRERGLHRRRRRRVALGDH